MLRIFSKKIGEGMYGTVYKIGKERVEKRYKPGTTSSTNEYNIMKKLNDLNFVPKVYKKTTTGYTMQRIPKNAIPLSNYLRNTTKINSNWQTILSKQLNEIHKKGVLHRDIHGRNIMVEFDKTTGKIKKMWIIDFGLSKLLPNQYRPININQNIGDLHNLFNRYPNIKSTQNQIRELKSKLNNPENYGENNIKDSTNKLSRLEKHLSRLVNK